MLYFVTIIRFQPFWYWNPMKINISGVTYINPNFSYNLRVPKDVKCVLLKKTTNFAKWVNIQGYLYQSKLFLQPQSPTRREGCSPQTTDFTNWVSIHTLFSEHTRSGYLIMVAKKQIMFDPKNDFTFPIPNIVLTWLCHFWLILLWTNATEGVPVGDPIHIFLSVFLGETLLG